MLWLQEYFIKHCLRVSGSLQTALEDKAELMMDYIVMSM